jgi:hypothetical protein
MKATFLFAFLSIFLLFGCITGIKSDEAKCDEQRTATPCTNTALWYAVLHKDANSAKAMCAKIDASGADAFVGSGKDRCYMEVARAVQDPSICSNIDSVNTVTRGLCVDRATPVRASTFCIPALVLPALALLVFVRRS